MGEGGQEDGGVGMKGDGGAGAGVGGDATPPNPTAATTASTANQGVVGCAGATGVLMFVCVFELPWASRALVGCRSSMASRPLGLTSPKYLYPFSISFCLFFDLLF